MIQHIILLSFAATLPLFASTYNQSATVVAQSKNEACSKALSQAKEEALSQAGTLVINDFISKETLKNNKEYNSLSSSNIRTLSVGIVKVLNKQESVSVDKNYQFICSVNASFFIDEKEMKQAVKKYLEHSQQKHNTIYVKATGYSENGQSRYRAIKAATLDAKRNLLDEIKGSELFSVIEAQEGELVSDKVINAAKGRIRYIKILSSKYDTNTKSAQVTVGITKNGLEKNFKQWLQKE